MITPAASPPERPDPMPASSWDIQAPYYPGAMSPITVGGDADAGGTDDVAGTVADAVSNAQARYHEHESDTYGLGSQIGDGIELPPILLDPAVSSLGTQAPDAGQYIPPGKF